MHIAWMYVFVYYTLNTFGVCKNFWNVAYLKGVGIPPILSIPSLGKKTTPTTQTTKNPKPQKTPFVPGCCTVPIKYDLHYNNLLYED